MSSRGSKAKNCHVTSNEYSTIKITKLGVKILTGNEGNHSLPDFAHTPNSVYAKVRKDGTLHEMRFYDSSGWPILEIAYHPERTLDDTGRMVVHFHSYNGLNRSDASLITDDIKEKYAEYLKEFDLYDKC